MANADAEHRQYVQSRMKYWQRVLTNIQDECTHEGHTRVNKTDSGYCETFYWTDCHCPHCDKHWTDYMKDETEQRLMSQLANARQVVINIQKQLGNHRRSKCPVKVGDVIETKQGERRKVYAVE